MLAVIELNAASHEPQSLSIACLVRSDVVRGPGVSSIGSLPRIIVDVSYVLAVLRHFCVRRIRIDSIEKQ